MRHSFGVSRIHAALDKLTFCGTMKPRHAYSNVVLDVYTLGPCNDLLVRLYYCRRNAVHKVDIYVGKTAKNYCYVIIFKKYCYSVSMKKMPTVEIVRQEKLYKTKLVNFINNDRFTILIIRYNFYLQFKLFIVERIYHKNNLS